MEGSDNVLRKYSVLHVTMLKLGKFLPESHEGGSGIQMHLYNAKLIKDFIYLGNKVIISLVPLRNKVSIDLTG